MCSPSGLIFGAIILRENEIFGKRVLEVGARNVNGSLRELLLQYEPSLYIGVDIEEGPGVDVVCDVCNLVGKFGTDSFDVVICTELLEHVFDWRLGVSNLIDVLKSKGIILITTRAPGFKYHGYPTDFWRYTPKDLESIFNGFGVIECREDLEAPGVFFAARKPIDFRDRKLDDYRLYSIITGKNEQSVPFRVIDMVQKNHKRRLCIRRFFLRIIDPVLNLFFPVEVK